MDNTDDLYNSLGNKEKMNIETALARAFRDTTNSAKVWGKPAPQQYDPMNELLFKLGLFNPHLVGTLQVSPATSGGDKQRAFAQFQKLQQAGLLKQIETIAIEEGLDKDELLEKVNAFIDTQNNAL